MQKYQITITYKVEAGSAAEAQKKTTAPDLSATVTQLILREVPVRPERPTLPASPVPKQG